MAQTAWAKTGARRIMTMLLLAAMFLLFLSQTTAAEEMVVLTVGSGDTLSGIAHQYLDRASRWRAVASVNSIANPDYILPGQKLRIPVSFLKGTPLSAAVSLVSGEAQVMPRGGQEWLPLRQGDTVPQGSTIRTGDRSSAEVVYADGTSLFLKPRTTIGITQAEQKGPLAQVRRFSLGIGKAITNLKSATGSGSRYEIRTPSAVASARGTQFRVSVDEGETTRAEVLEGSVLLAGGRGKVVIHDGEGSVVRKGAGPAPSRHLLPLPRPRDLKGMYKTLPLRVTFDAVPGVQAYEVVLTRDENGKDIVVEKRIGPEEAFTVADIPDGSYYLSGSSSAASGLAGAYSSPVAFIVRTNPAPPIIQSPNDGAEIRSQSAAIRWLKVKDAVRFRFQLSNEKEFASPRVERPDIADTTVTIDRLEPGAYYFRVSSVAADDFESEWSDATQFIVVPPPPSPQLDKPEVGDSTLHFGWRNMGPGMTYHFQMAGDEEFAGVLVDTRTDKPVLELPRTDEAGTYFVRISTVDPTGYEGTFSAPQSFEVPKRFPYGLGAIAVMFGLIFLIVP